MATFTGWVPDEDVTAWFSAADVAVFPYPKPFSSSGALALALAHRTPALLSPPLARSVGAPSVMTVPMDAEVARPSDRRARRLTRSARRTAPLVDGARRRPALAGGRRTSRSASTRR